MLGGVAHVTHVIMEGVSATSPNPHRHEKQRTWLSDRVLAEHVSSLGFTFQY